MQMSRAINAGYTSAVNIPVYLYKPLDPSF